MKKLVTGLFAIVITCTTMAQPPVKSTPPPPLPSAEGNRGEHKGPKGDKMEHMMEKLNLTADQKAKMKIENQSFKKQMDDLKAQSLTEEQRKAKRKELMKARKEQISAILTVEQRKQWEEMKKEHGGHRRGDKAEKED